MSRYQIREVFFLVTVVEKILDAVAEKRCFSSLGSIGLASQLQMVYEAKSFISVVLQRDLMSLFSLFRNTWKSFL